MTEDLHQAALDYHAKPSPGKIGIIITKPSNTLLDLSLSYTPGVAEPVKEISKVPELAYLYTNKANLVGVITNGTAILGLGDLGALASKPVMEGKAVLFKRFAEASHQTDLQFGPDYILPLLIDPRLKQQVSKAVARAAMDSGVAENEFSR